MGSACLFTNLKVWFFFCLVGKFETAACILESIPATADQYKSSCCCYPLFPYTVIHTLLQGLGATISPLTVLVSSSTVVLPQVMYLIKVAGVWYVKATHSMLMEP